MRGTLGILFATVVAGLAVAGIGAGFAPSASAGALDLAKLSIDYTVSADGVLHVTETIDYHFSCCDKHGIYRDLVIREPFADDQSKDQKYEVSNIKVSSPTSQVATDVDTSTLKQNGARDQMLRIKIGRSDQTVPDDATYRLTYDVRGALRHFPDHSELFWDATGSGWDASLSLVTVSVTVPQGVQKVACFAGPAGSTKSCDQKSISGGKALFVQPTGVYDGEQLSIVAALKAGAVSNDVPIVVDPPGFLERHELNPREVVVSAALAIVAVITRAWYRWRGNRDDRYDGMPPGAVPPEGFAVRTVRDNLSEDEIPVAYAPPKIPVAEGGLLVDGKANTTEVAATLIDLAVRGAVRIDHSAESRKVVLVDPEIATESHERSLLRGLFPQLEAGTEVELGEPKPGDYTMARAARFTIDAVRNQVEQKRWYARMPRRTRLDASGGDGWAALGCVLLFSAIVMVLAVVIGSVKFGAPSWVGPAAAIGVPLVAIALLLVTYVGKSRHGRRTAIGRAITDQVIGFRKYLATAEADQLHFEDGDDVFSRYLPWAIVFDLADHWQQVCRKLVESGRLTAEPGWYSGSSYYSSGWSANSLSTSVAQSFSTPSRPSTGGGGGTSSGFSSSSSSSSSSGGGGGGGGGGSW